MTTDAPQRTLVFRIACDPRAALPWLSQPSILKSSVELLDRETQRSVAEALGRTSPLSESDPEFKFARPGSILENRAACASIKGDLAAVVAAADRLAESLPAQTASAIALRVAERVSRIAIRAGHGDAVEWISSGALALWQRSATSDSVAFAVSKQAPSTLDGACALRTLAGRRVEAHRCHTDTVDELSTRPVGSYVVVPPALSLVREAWRLDLIPTIPATRPVSAAARYAMVERCECGRCKFHKRLAFIAASESDVVRGFTEALDANLCPLHLTALLDTGSLVDPTFTFTAAFEIDHPRELV